jgi:hypothetical protein
MMRADHQKLVKGRVRRKDDIHFVPQGWRGEGLEKGIELP